MVTVAQYYQIIDWLGLMDASRELASIYVINFLINLYLILLISVQIFDSR
jgi:hypothetical protein